MSPGQRPSRSWPPRPGGRVVTAKLITYLLAGAAYGLARDLVGLAVALPWLSARGHPRFMAGHGNLTVLAAVIASATFAAGGTLRTLRRDIT